MHDASSNLGLLRDPQLAVHAAASRPAWLWSADATRVLWANPVGAAIFGAASPAAIAGSTIDPNGSAALQIARIAGSLAQGAAARLERLRGFGGKLGAPLICACSRITLADGTPAILVTSVDEAGPALTPAEHAQRLLDQIDDPVALWASDGALLWSTSQAKKLMGEAASLSTLGVEAPAAEAVRSGKATGETSGAQISLERIGEGPTALLLMTLIRREPQSAAEPPAVSSVEATSQADPSAGEIAPERAAPDAASEALEPEPQPIHNQPLRFVWQIDTERRFTLTSETFIEAIGPEASSPLGQPWDDVAAKLELDPDGQVAAALASRGTWSGITVSFPADGSDTRLPVEMSGLPVFDRNREFRGYRGFGICRDRERIEELLRGRAAERQAQEEAQGETQHEALQSEPDDLSDKPADELLQETPASAERPALSVVPPSPNVVPFRGGGPGPAGGERPSLTPVEHKAFGELASRLTARLRGSEADPPMSAVEEAEAPAVLDDVHADGRSPSTSAQRDLLDRLPVGVLVYRLDNLLYANKAFLEWTGYGRLDALADAGGLDALFVEPGVDSAGEGDTRTLAISTQNGASLPVAARLFSTPWEGETALVLMLDHPGAAGHADPTTAADTANAELRAMLDVAAEGVVLIDREGRIVSLNRRAQALFGDQDGSEAIGLPFAGLFASESQRTALDLVSHAASTNIRPEGREVGIRRADGTALPLFMSVGRVGEDRLCAVFQDIGPWKQAEADLTRARLQAEQESEAKSDFLGRVSHEIRTPLNAIIGFSEVMIEERFGPVGNERYAQYLKDIRGCGEHVIALLNDLVDLSHIESGKLELDFTNLDLNALTQECVAAMQPQASRERVIIRSALSPSLRAVTADARSLRQIVRNLLSHSIRLTGPGGQVIVSTALNEAGDAVLRVRDTGAAMSEKDIAAALEPFRQTGTSLRVATVGTGLGLPLTKALVEANRATFSISSASNAGTLVEVAFPAALLAAE